MISHSELFHDTVSFICNLCDTYRSSVLHMLCDLFFNLYQQFFRLNITDTGRSYISQTATSQSSMHVIIQQDWQYCLSYHTEQRASFKETANLENGFQKTIKTPRHPKGLGNRKWSKLCTRTLNGYCSKSVVLKCCANFLGPAKCKERIVRSEQYTLLVGASLAK